MALVVFLRGINVGGHRAFRPAELARELAIYDVVNVGAAGTFVVRKPGAREEFLGELRRRLPFEATIAECDSGDLIGLEKDNPFGAEPPAADVVRFVSVLSEAGRDGVSPPITLPECGEWLVRIIGAKGRLLYGVYRRHMRTIGHLGQIDRVFGAPATTRSWTTILSILTILRPITEEGSMNLRQTSFTTMDDYIAAFPSDIRAILEKIRSTISDAAPEATEKISYNMPTFWQGRDIVSFGAFKAHIGLFPPVREPDLVEETLAWRGEKGNLRFPLDQPIPYDLIGRIVRARLAKMRMRISHI